MADISDPFVKQMYQSLAAADSAGDTDQAEYIAQQIKQYRGKKNASDNRSEILRQTVDSPAGSLYAGMQSFIDQIPFDLGNKAEHAVGNALIPNYDPQLADDLASAAQQQHPISSGVGSVAGFADTAAMLAAATPGIMLPKAGQAVSNVLKAGAEGALFSGGEAAAQGASPSDTAIAAGAGAVAGPVVGKIAGSAISYAEKALPKAWKLVAKKIGVTPDDLKQYLREFERNTGQKPSIQQVLESKAAGGLRKFAKENPDAGRVLQEAAARRDTELPGQVASALTKTIPRDRPKFLVDVNPETQTPAALLNARDEAMTKAITKIENDPVAVPAEMFSERAFASNVPRALRKDIRDQLEAIDPEDETASVFISVRDADNIRRKLRRAQKSPSNVGEDFGELADEIGDLAASQSKGYGEALDDYGKASKYIEGFQHSYGSGADAGSAVSPELRRALSTEEGNRGHAAGLATYTRNKAASSPDSAASVSRSLGDGGSVLSGMEEASGRLTARKAARTAGALEKGRRATQQSTPRALAPTEEGSAGKHLVYGAAESAAGLHFSGLAHIGRAVFRYLSRHNFPPKVQQEIADGLSSNDPKVVNTTLQKLRKSETDMDSLVKLTQAVSGATGRNVGEMLSPEQRRAE